jgi:hypothetical protein
LSVHRRNGAFNGKHGGADQIGHQHNPLDPRLRRRVRY